MTNEQKALMDKQIQVWSDIEHNQYAIFNTSESPMARDRAMNELGAYSGRLAGAKVMYGLMGLDWPLED